MTDYNRDEAEFTPRPKYGPRFNAADVRAFRDENECGMLTAKECLMKEQLLNDIQGGRATHNVTLLYDIVEYMIENRYG